MKVSEKRTGSLIGAIAVSFAAFLWGVDGIILRPSLYHLDVTIVVFLEHFIAFLLMTAFLFREIDVIRKIKRLDWAYFFWIALFGGAIGTMAITQALFLVNFHNLSVILILQKLQPLFAIFIAAILLKERPSKQFYGWAFLAIVGSYLITFGFKQPVFVGNMLPLAAGLSLLAAFSWGSCTAVGKKVVNIASFRTATYVRFGLTSLIMFAIIILTGSIAGITSVDAGDITTLVIIALTTGGTAIFIYYYGLKRVMASNATIYELAFPITAVALDYVLHGSVMTAGQMLGALIIIISMLMITRKNIHEDEENIFYE
ncbi:MAG: DMT family transporter [Candidatus Micrarchaeota archaeon]|nr:DMT family transporter [Candidatus Micrarchaeota archaeon]